MQYVNKLLSLSLPFAMSSPMINSLEQANKVIEQQHTQIEKLSRQLHSSERKVNMLQHQVEQLLRRIYGRRSEKMDPNQLMFDGLLLEALEQPAAPHDDAATQQPDITLAGNRSSAARRRHPGRLPIPEHVERVEIILDISAEDKVARRLQSRSKESVGKSQRNSSTDLADCWSMHTSVPSTPHPTTPAPGMWA